MTTALLWATHTAPPPAAPAEGGGWLFPLLAYGFLFYAALKMCGLIRRQCDPGQAFGNLIQKLTSPGP